jgi:hypothetical protein
MTDWVKDIQRMHAHFDMHKSFANFDEEKKRMFLEFRAKFIQEEVNELFDNLDNPEEVVDALIDICVVAIGTLDAFGIDAHKAWNEVLRANMTKEVGIKEGRPNPTGLPDLCKPTKETHGYDWVPPDHTGNHGNLPKS